MSGVKQPFKNYLLLPEPKGLRELFSKLLCQEINLKLILNLKLDDSCT